MAKPAWTICWFMVMCVTSWPRPGNGEEPPLAAPQSASEAAAAAFFQDKVLPIFQQRCYECHSHASGKAKGSLMLDSRDGWLKGGDSGAAIVPGKPEESLLLLAVRYADLKMPPTGKLAAEEIATIERWISAGAFDPRRTDGANMGASIDLAAGRKHWVFQPLRRNSPPTIRDATWPLHDVDRFVMAKLDEQQLTPVADADQYTWLRRVTFDLTGLPPTPEEMASFIDDTSPQAYERVVDRLLASRAFGERWARHWLDLVGYADQIGTANNIFAAHAWRYRDYVIAAFHEDKPFDSFLREQIAGDLLPSDSSAERAANLTATGFLLLGDLTVVEADKAKLRVDVIDQQIDKIGKAMLGMTIACARCHDHKFDPIPQHDYYAMAGYLHGTESIQRAEWGVWSWPTMVELPETDLQQAERQRKTAEYRLRVEALKSERELARVRQAEIEASLKQLQAGQSAAGTNGSDAAASDPRKANDARKANESKPGLAAREALEKELKELGDRRKRLDTEITHAEFFAPAAPMAFAVRDDPQPGDMRITIRGNPHAMGNSVPRGVLQVVTGDDQPAIPRGESGRRQLADWITDPKNPLTSRVVVNRIWQKLFGEGIVRSVDYFGLRGETPSHPELLDYLAARFVAEGWSQKRLIRDLTLTRTYRMSSLPDADSQAVDPENRFLWRMNRRRLDAEALRDAQLLVAGTLQTKAGGPSLPLEYPENTGGLGPKEVNPPNFRLSRFRPEQPFERTLFLPIIRSGPQAGPGELRNVFDFTQPAEFAGQRAVTAVPTQSLFLMNAEVMKQRSAELAQRIMEEAPEDRRRLETLWLRVLNRPIAAAERDDAIAFLADVRRDETASPERPATNSAAAELRSWSELCHALLASNEFLTRM